MCSFRSLEQLSANASFGGSVTRHQHRSEATGTEMKFSIFHPAEALAGDRVPVLYWLSGLTCTEENFITKAGAQKYLAEHGIMVVCPDTSPRGTELPGEHDRCPLPAIAPISVVAHPWLLATLTRPAVRLTATTSARAQGSTSKHRQKGSLCGPAGAATCRLLLFSLCLTPWGYVLPRVTPP